MKNLFGWMLVVLLVLTAGVSCSDDEELLAGNGIADAAWSAENQVEIEGGVLNYTFAAASDWTAPEFGWTGAKCKPVRVWRANRCCV